MSIEEQLDALRKASADQLEELRKETAASRLLDGLKADIEPIATKKAQSVKSYNAKHDDLLRQWKWQETELEGHKADIIATFPNYATLINTRICKIRDDIAAQKAGVDKLTPAKGTKEAAVATARLGVDASKAALAAWLAADTKLAAQLGEIDKGIDQLKDVFGGADSVLSIYLLWFKLLPRHQEIAPRGGASPPADPAEAAPAEPEKPECLPVPDPDAVYLIAPADYGGKLDAAWQAYRAARETLKTAEEAFNTAPDDLATATKQLKKMNDTQDDDIKKALKA
jgi:chromosome segregation ATPase